MLCFVLCYFCVNLNLSSTNLSGAISAPGRAPERGGGGPLYRLDPIADFKMFCLYIYMYACQLWHPLHFLIITGRRDPPLGVPSLDFFLVNGGSFFSCPLTRGLGGVTHVHTLFSPLRLCLWLLTQCPRAPGLPARTI